MHVRWKRAYLRTQAMYSDILDCGIGSANQNEAIDDVTGHVVAHEIEVLQWALRRANSKGAVAS